MGKVTFTKKQNDLMRLFKRNKLPRLTVLQGSVRSGKTWISLILWALWVATRPRDYLYMMTAKIASDPEAQLPAATSGAYRRKKFYILALRKGGRSFWTEDNAGGRERRAFRE